MTAVATGGAVAWVSCGSMNLIVHERSRETNPDRLALPGSTWASPLLSILLWLIGRGGGNAPAGLATCAPPCISQVPPAIQ